MLNLITEHLDVWTTAEQPQKNGGRGKSSNNNKSPHGIQKLRELILELAVRGKLVPQDQNEEPASELLKKIAAEKSRLIKEGKIKKQKLQFNIIEEEKAFDVPSGWQWVRFGDIALHNAGKTLDRGRNSGMARDYITTSNLYWGRFDLDAVKQMPIREEELEKCTARKGDLLICEGGEAGRAAVWNKDYEICFQNHVHRARFYFGVDAFYAYRFFEMLNATGQINEYRKGVGISNMSGKALASIPFVLPPLEEQHRIVAKVDELMALCDRLEQEQAESGEAHRLLVQTVLAALVRPSAEGESEDNAVAIFFDHFDTLFTTEESIDQLKQTILQLAVMGKLAPQNPNDEPAAVLLEKIAAEKSRLIKEGKIKKQKLLPEIGNDEKPSALPNGWERVQLGTVAVIERGGSPRPISAFLTDDPDGLNWIKIGDTDQGGKYITSTNEKIRKEGLIKTRMVFPGDFLLTNSMSFGRPYITQIEGCIHDGWLRISPPTSIDKDYLYLLLSSPYVANSFKAAAAGAVVQNLNADKVRETVILIPPSNEQHRIVAKVDELMALCDALKERLQSAQQTQVHLADAIIEQAVG